MRRLPVVRLLPGLLLLSLACSGGGGGGGTDGGTTSRHYTWRAVGGVSMGAIGTGWVGAPFPERFDALGPLGGILDLQYFLAYIEESPMGGFCTYQDYLDVLAGDPAALDDVAAMDGCAVPPREPLRFEHPMRFNDWWYDDNGGTFDRDSYIELLEDLALALGNPAYHNPESPFFPPGVDDDWSCEAPVVIPGTDSGGTAPVYNDRFNPEGRFDAITFCDGEEPIVICQGSGVVVDFCDPRGPDGFCGVDGPVVTLGKSEAKADYPDIYYREKGAYDPCRPHTKRLRVMLAVDYDSDGRRDYGEPIVANGRERWDDVGADGCASTEEDGRGGCTDAASSPYDPAANPDPNADDHHWETAGLGTEGDSLWQEGEPFDDLGLDGVAGTGDFGEGNGVYDFGPNAERWLAADPRGRIRSWTDEELATTELWMDGGIRDLFNLGVSAAQTWGAVRARTDDARWYSDFDGLPHYAGEWTGPFDFQDVDYPALSPHSLFLYGDPDATDAEWRRGDGAHVGTVTQALNRFNLLFAWLSERWPGGDTSDEDYGSFSELVFDHVYFSDALGSDRLYSIALPPGYFDPANAEKSYPVVYFMHGYGQDPTGMSAANVVFTGYMAEGILEKMIIVYVDGRCCHVNDRGERDCYEPGGASFGPGWSRECHRGSFYADGAGRDASGGTPYREAVYDLMDHVEGTYRVKAPADVPLAP